MIILYLLEALFVIVSVFLSLLLFLLLLGSLFGLGFSFFVLPPCILSISMEVVFLIKKKKRNLFIGLHILNNDMIIVFMTFEIKFKLAGFSFSSDLVGTFQLEISV